jgi:hypothetical protein
MFQNPFNSIKPVDVAPVIVTAVVEGGDTIPDKL